MKKYLIGMAVLAGATLSVASAQTAGTSERLFTQPTTKATATTVNLSSGGGLLTPGQGANECAVPDPIAGQGLFPFDNTGATIGASNEGQIEALCSFYGFTAVQDDIWFEWTADADGIATMTTELLTVVDTKIAVYPGTGGCPTNGTAIACNDDSPLSGTYQSTVVFSVVNGGTYLLQLGEYPSGTSTGGGTGSFDISIVGAPPCGTLDTGVADNSFTLNVQSDLIWMNKFDCTTAFDGAEVVFGGALLAGAGATGPPNGTPYEIHVWDDTDMDGNPLNATLVHTETGLLVANTATDIYNQTLFSSTITVTGDAWIGVEMNIVPVAGQFEAPSDSTYYGAFPDHSVYVYDTITGLVDPANIAAADSAFYDDSIYMIRAIPGNATPVQPFCMADGSSPGVSCPCGNTPLVGSGEGCVNVTGNGAYITGSGSPQVTNDTLVLTVNNAAPSDFGIFVQNFTLQAVNMPFYNGVLCLNLDGNLVRHYAPPAVLPTVTDAAGMGVNAQPMTVGDFLNSTQPGVTMYYQFWYRDNGGPCGTGANFAAGASTTWF